MLLNSKLLVGTAAAAAALLASPASAQRRAQYAPAPALAPAPAPAPAACSSTLDIVLQLSGSSGYDSDSGDFDLLRELVLFAGIEGNLASPAAGGLSDVTVFAPTDKAFTDLAIAFGYLADTPAYSAYPYDEAGTFAYLAGVLGTLAGDGPDALKGLVTDILLYHIADGAIDLGRLVSMGTKSTTVTTLSGGLPLELRMNAYSCITLIHKADPANFPYPKVDKVLLDLDTCNGKLNVLSAAYGGGVLVPL